MNWVSLAKEVGPLITLIFFFLARDWKREERLLNMMGEKDNFIQKIAKRVIDAEKYKPN
jgi:hypothetical protein